MSGRWTLDQPPQGVDGQRWSLAWFLLMAIPEVALVYVPAVRKAWQEWAGHPQVWRVGLELEGPPDYDSADNPYGGKLAEERRQDRRRLGADTPEDLAVHLFASLEASVVVKSPQKTVFVSPKEPAYELLKLLDSKRAAVSETPLQHSLSDIPDLERRLAVAMAITELRRRPAGRIRERARRTVKTVPGLAYRSRRTAREPFTDLSDPEVDALYHEAQQVVEAVRGRFTEGVRSRMSRRVEEIDFPGQEEALAQQLQVQREFWYLLPDELGWLISPPQAGGRHRGLMAMPEEIRSDSITAADLMLLRLNHDPTDPGDRKALNKILERARPEGVS